MFSKPFLIIFWEQRFRENIALQEHFMRRNIYTIDAPKNLLLLFHQTKLESAEKETTIKLHSASVYWNAP
jgi:hypothetical protein